MDYCATVIGYWGIGNIMLIQAVEELSNKELFLQRRKLIYWMVFHSALTTGVGAVLGLKWGSNAAIALGLGTISIAVINFGIGLQILLPSAIRSLSRR